MNRKERRLALRTALMARITDAVVVMDFGRSLKSPKTRDHVAFITAIDVPGKVLLLTELFIFGTE